MKRLAHMGWLLVIGLCLTGGMQAQTYEKLWKHEIFLCESTAKEFRTIGRHWQKRTHPSC